MPIHPRDTLAGAVILALVCWAMPLGLRLWSLGPVWLRPPGVTLVAGYRMPDLLPLLGDLLAGGQLFALGMLVHGFVGNPWGAALLFAPAAVAAHLLIVLDHVLWREVRLRLSCHFISYARHLPLLAGSSARAGVRLRHLALATASYSVLLGLATAMAFRMADAVASPTTWALLAGILTLLGGFAGWRSAAEPATAPQNVLLRLEQQAARWMLERRAVEAPLPAGFLEAAFPEERFTPSSPATPLMRTTHGYTGDRRFDLELGGDRPHVILLFLESFCASAIGAIGEDVGASPEFDRLARHGMLFRQFYGNGVQTARAVVSSLFGVLPRFSEQPVQADRRHGPRLIGLPQFFGEMGYANAYFHNGSLAFERQDIFFPRHGFHELHGHQEIRDRYPEAKILGGWGVPDEFLMRYFVDWLADGERDAQPTFSTLFTMTNHHPFLVPEGFRTPPFEFPGNPWKEEFLRTFYYTDHCLGLLIRLLHARGLDRRSLIVILADTAQPLGEHDNWTEQNGLFEENLRIPLLILAPAYLRAPGVVEAPASQLDLLPTFIDLFQRSFRHHALGTSLARVTGERAILFNSPFGARTLGIRRGQFKLIHKLATETAALYDLASDPGERKNVAASRPGVAEALKRELVATHAAIQTLYAQDRFC